jgi:hypothetical protein
MHNYDTEINHTDTKTGCSEHTEAAGIIAGSTLVCAITVGLITGAISYCVAEQNEGDQLSNIPVGVNNGLYGIAGGAALGLIVGSLLARKQVKSWFNNAISWCSPAKENDGAKASYDGSAISYAPL